jgi:hypothetical protein
LAAPNNITKFFEAFKGLDLRSSDILRGKTAATELKNMQYRQTGALTKRKGYKFMSHTDGGYGMTTFKNVNQTTGAVSEETIVIDDNLHKIVNNTFTISYAGSNTAKYSCYLHTDSNFYFDVYDGSTRVVNHNLGTGLEGSPVDVTALVAVITAVSDFTAGTITNSSGSHSAAFILASVNTVITSGGTLIPYRTITAITTPGTYTTPFSTFYGQRTDANFENATFAQINDVLYISTGHDVLHKYDGTRCYKAGLPKATDPTLLTSGANPASFTAGRKLAYKIEIEYTDAKGNLVYSDTSEVVEVTVDGSGNGIDITYTELLSNSGYDTDSSNLKYNIFRSDESADYSAATNSLFYLVHTADHGDSIPYEDAGNALGAQFVEPIKQRGLPPSGRYIDTWRGQLLISGILTDSGKVAYSDIDNVEYFPASDNSFIVNNKVTGIKSMNNVVYVFQDRTIDGVTGDFGTDQFQVDNLSKEGIGCSAHHSIAEVQGQLFFLSNRGVRAINAEGIEPVGFAIEPKFDVGNPFTFKQAVGYHWERQDKYMLFMPSLPVDASYASDDSNEIYAYDIVRKAWLEWDNFNFMGGITETDGDLYFNRRVLSNTNMCRVHSENSKYDYADHTAGISFVYKSHWEIVGQPSVYKKFLRIKVHSYDTSVNDFEVDSFALTVKTENDYNLKTLTNISLDFSGGASGWGLGPWGQFPWGESRLVQLRSKLASKKAKSMRTIFENNTVHENVLISGYEIDVSSSYKQRLKA